MIHPRRAVSRRKKPDRLLIIVWSLYFIAGIISLLWIVSDSRQFLAKYQKSPECSPGDFTAVPQNCRMKIQVRVDTKWISNTPGGGAKGGGYWNKMNFNVRLPDGDRRTLSVPINNQGLSEQGEFNGFYLGRFLEMEPGKIAQAEYWEGRVISVTIPIPVLLGDPFTEYTDKTFLTDDHPIYSRSENLSKALSLLGILFIGIILWTAFVILRH